MKYKVKYVNAGWDDINFESRIDMEINNMVSKGWIFKDIKVSSNGNDTLLIFSRVN